jgi:hypothetical protein
MSPLAEALIVFAMELVSAFISFLVGYYASKAYRASLSRSLQFLYLGFAVLGIGISLRAMTAIYLLLANRIVDTVPSFLVGISNTAGIVFTITQLIAYSLFIATYVYREKGKGEPGREFSGVAVGAVFPLARLFYSPALELVAISMLGFVAYSSMVNWRHRRTEGSALVFYGFALMCASHVLFLFMLFNEYLFLLGQVAQLAGFLCMLLMLVKVNRTNAQGH